MEYLEGMSLDDWLKKGRKPTLAQAARIGRQIALGLADAHGCGLIHRDIKPGNVWLDSRHQGRVKLLDFGLARGDSGGTSTDAERAPSSARRRTWPRSRPAANTSIIAAICSAWAWCCIG